ncbi:hypothetical protein Tco_1042537 [Tanacetum coccineum]|uniref:Uncharacterized protein n=1 Tax=Tanacetum coccineum TaxID=301880 RepID=A0ABQ5GJE2_9ASTR
MQHLYPSRISVDPLQVILNSERECEEGDNFRKTLRFGEQKIQIDIKEPFSGARLLPLRSSFTVTIVVFGGPSKQTQVEGPSSTGQDIYLGSANQLNSIKSQGSSASLSVSCESAKLGNPRPMQFSRSWWYHTHYNICHYPQRQIWGFRSDLSLGIAFPGDMSPEISGTEKLEWDSFSGDIPGRHRWAQIVSVKQLSATVDGFPGRHVARDTKIN